MKPIARVEDFPFEKKAWYSPAEIGHLLGVGAPTVRRWMQFLGVPAQIRWTRGKRAPKIDDDELDRAES